MQEFRQYTLIEKTTVFTLNQNLGIWGKIVGVKIVTINIICMKIVQFLHGKCSTNLTFWKVVKIVSKIIPWDLNCSSFRSRNLYKLDKENFQWNYMNIENRFMGTCYLYFVYSCLTFRKLNQKLYRVLNKRKKKLSTFFYNFKMLKIRVLAFR